MSLKYEPGSQPLQIKADPQRYVELRDAFNALDYSKSGTIDVPPLLCHSPTAAERIRHK